MLIPNNVLYSASAQGPIEGRGVTFRIAWRSFFGAIRRTPLAHTLVSTDVRNLPPKTVRQIIPRITGRGAWSPAGPRWGPSPHNRHNLAVRSGRAILNVGGARHGRPVIRPLATFRPGGGPERTLPLGSRRPRGSP